MTRLNTRQRHDNETERFKTSLWTFWLTLGFQRKKDKKKKKKGWESVTVRDLNQLWSHLVLHLVLISLTCWRWHKAKVWNHMSTWTRQSHHNTEINLSSLKRWPLQVPHGNTPRSHAVCWLIYTADILALILPCFLCSAFTDSFQKSGLPVFMRPRGGYSGGCSTVRMTTAVVWSLTFCTDLECSPGTVEPLWCHSPTPGLSSLTTDNVSTDVTFNQEDHMM